MTGMYLNKSSYTHRSTCVKKFNELQEREGERGREGERERERE